MADFSSEDITRIGRGLMDRTLPKPEWTHRAHFAAALYILACRPELDVAAAMPEMIRSYNESTGMVNDDHHGYHETITVASLRAARRFLRECEGMEIAAVCNALLAGPLGKPDWILAYWSRDRLFSVAARLGWAEPDLKELGF